MISYPYISTLFTNILSKSKAIEGRFYVCPKGGNEINSDMLNEVLQQVNTPKKYPLVLMMPPRSNEDKLEWSAYYITMFFLKTTYYGTGNVLSANTNTSIISIQNDWAVMRQSAKEFIEVLAQVQKINLHKYFRIGKSSINTTPVTEIGADRASGVRLDFQLELYEGCDPLEDYDVNDISLINVPA